MLILGHRGASALAPENTVLAFRLALEAGAAGSELDVRMTADGVCVCAHDGTVVIGGQERRVCDVARSDLEGLSAGSAPAIPTLAEAIDALRGSVVMAEIKNHPWDVCFDETQSVADAVARVLGPDAIVACFDPAALERIREIRPELATAVITGAAFDPQANLEAAVAGDHGICSVEHTVITPEFVEAAHARGKEVFAWATDDPADVRRLAASGVDALMCDDPGRALAALRRER